MNPGFPIELMHLFGSGPPRWELLCAGIAEAIAGIAIPPLSSERRLATAAARECAGGRNG